MMILAETVDGLLNMIDSLSRYAHKWDLTVNINKTKVVVFRNGEKVRNNEKWLSKHVHIDEYVC